MPDEKPKRGRPKAKEPRVHTVTTYLSDQERDELEAAALREGRTRSDILRSGIGVSRRDMVPATRRTA